MSYFIVNTAVANVYHEAAHNSAVVTQALLGESCRILDNWDDWYLIRQWDGYEGWIYHFYGVERNTRYKPNMYLQDLFGRIIAPDKKRMERQLLFGSSVKAQTKHGGYQLILPDGRRGFSHNNFSAAIQKPTRKKIIKTAEQFIGTPYIWGGKTPYGIDCSGLVQTVFKAHGIDLPRDAHQQEKNLSKNIISMAEIKSGDLLFFSENDRVTHVAISTGGADFINARGYVKCESIAEKSPRFSRKLHDIFLHAVSIKNLLKK